MNAIAEHRRENVSLQRLAASRFSRVRGEEREDEDDAGWQQ